MKFKYLWILTFAAGCLLTMGYYHFYPSTKEQSTQSAQKEDTIWRSDISGEIINTSDKNYEGDKLEGDLNNDGEKEVVFQQLISAANGVRLIIADHTDNVLYSTLTRVGKLEMKDNSVYLTSSDAEGTSVMKIFWDGKKWDVSST